MCRPVVLTACFALLSSGAMADEAIMELQTEPLTPGLVLNESQRPAHQIRLLVDNKGKHGTLVLDPNVPRFDEFGNLVGGIVTPQTSGKGGPLPAVKLECDIEFIKAGPEKWLLFRLRGPKISSQLLVATRGPILDGRPARLLVLANDKRVTSVLGMTRYGLAIP